MIGKIEVLVNHLAQEIAINLKAQSVTYNKDKDSWTYFCTNNIVHEVSRKEIESFAKAQIDNALNFPTKNNILHFIKVKQ